MAKDMIEQIAGTANDMADALSEESRNLPARAARRDARLAEFEQYVKRVFASDPHLAKMPAAERQRIMIEVWPQARHKYGGGGRDPELKRAAFDEMMSQYSPLIAAKIKRDKGGLVRAVPPELGPEAPAEGVASKTSAAKGSSGAGGAVQITVVPKELVERPAKAAIEGGFGTNNLDDELRKIGPQ